MKKILCLFFVIILSYSMYSKAECEEIQEYINEFFHDASSTPVSRNFDDMYNAYRQFCEWWGAPIDREMDLMKSSGAWFLADGNIVYETEAQENGKVKLILLQLSVSGKSMDRDSTVRLISLCASLQYSMPETISERERIMNDVSSEIEANWLTLLFMEQGDEKPFQMIHNPVGDAELSWLYDEYGDYYLVARLK